ncbi:MAG: ElyC/SanA/YdcF family protein [Solirubrobacteraceae bacterium]
MTRSTPCAARRGRSRRDIFTDHAGFDTWSSMVRAQKVFGVESALVVTQRFHLPRGVAGRARRTRRARRLIGPAWLRQAERALVARPKAVQEVVVGRDPQFLGPQIPITGYGRASRG